jgi:hypothetical protein
MKMPCTGLWVSCCLVPTCWAQQPALLVSGAKDCLEGTTQLGALVPERHHRLSLFRNSHNPKLWALHSVILRGCTAVAGALTQSISGMH